jgi:murein DD-endopeptidase MepM/ murein hydrolase activator NlpD
LILLIGQHNDSKNMARKSHYKFCPESLTYIKIDKNLRTHINQAFPYIIASSIIGISIYFFTAFTHKTPREKMLIAENYRLEADINKVDDKLKEFDNKLYQLERTDDSLYRSILGSKPLPLSYRMAGMGGSSDKLLKPKNNLAIISDSYNKLESLFSRLKVQKKSYELLFNKAKLNNNRLKQTPAIIPISNKDLTKIGSGFGRRLHPILNFIRPHRGIDFHSSVGTPVYATADGTVVKADYSSTFGNLVQIDHGFGVSTVYAHLSKIIAKPGTKVIRGEEIGLVGNTGLSAGPHLHYEVHLNGIEVDPVNYFFNDLTPAEYEKVVEIAQQYKVSMD